MSGSYTVAPTESQIYTAVRAWLIQTLPAVPAINIMQGQLNRVAAPVDPFVTMLIIDRERVATNQSAYDGVSTETITSETQVKMQINVFGAASSNYMQAIATLWRDEQTTEFFDSYGIALDPLYTSDVRQLGFITGEKQYDDQWTIDLEMQVNFTIGVPQQFATSLQATIVSVDVAYPI